LNREILALAIPNFLSAVTVPLVGAVDTALVGHLGQVAFIGAVSIGAVLFDTLYWAFGFLRMGTTALVAQSYGAGDDRRAGQVLIQSTIVGIVAGTLIVVFRHPLTEIGLRLAGGSEEVVHWARAYVMVRIVGAPLVLVTYALNGFFRGMKDAVTPLIVTLVVHTVNVVGDVGFIYGRMGMPELGVVGAAWASLAAAAAGFLVAGAVLVVRYRHVLSAALPTLFERDGVFDPTRLRKLGTTHFNLFLRTIFLLAAYFLMVATASRLGDVALAANAIVLQLWHLSSYSVDGVAFASETLVGNALGAGDGRLTRRLTRRCLVWGVGLGCVFSLVYLVGMRTIAGIFTDDASVTAVVVSLTMVTALSQPINAVAFIYDGVFIGANDMPYLFRQMAVSFCLVFIPALLVLVHWLDFGLQGLWVTMLLFMAARSVTLEWKYRQHRWIEERLAAAEM
jgi:MATE family multidrug resistance protein